MKIYAVLHQEHVQILRLLQRARRATGQKRRVILNEAIDELTAHGRAEEEVLYDRLSDVADVHALMLASKEEHLVATRIMADLAVMDADDERCAAKISVLSVALRHHIAQEEDGLFAQARLLFDDVIAENFAGEFVEAKAAAQLIAVEDRLIEALALGRFGRPPQMISAGDWGLESGFKSLSEEPTANGYARFSGNF